MQIKVSTKNSVTTMALVGRFDFNSHREFRNACDEVMLVPGVKEIEVDFGHVDYLDSSALGMLLLLREKTQAAHLNVTLSHCNGLVQQVIEVANFEKLFTIR